MNKDMRNKLLTIQRLADIDKIWAGTHYKYMGIPEFRQKRILNLINEILEESEKE